MDTISNRFIIRRLDVSGEFIKIKIEENVPFYHIISKKGGVYFGEA